MTAALSSLDQKLRDAQHYLRAVAPLLPIDTTATISSAAEDTAGLLHSLINTIVCETHTALVTTIHVVAGRLLRAYQAVSSQVAGLSRKRRPTQVNDDLRTFLSKIGSRGWRVNEQAPSSDEEDQDDFSDLLLQQAQRPKTALLATDTFADLLTFPVLLSGSKITSAAASACREHDVKYMFRNIYGNYVMIPNMVLIGVHRDAMRVQEGKRVVMDTEKFDGLLPWMRNQSPWHHDVLHHAAPVLQPRQYGGHYYCPVVPQRALQSRFELGEWSLLISAN